jgi:hypothetical protein
VFHGWGVWDVYAYTCSRWLYEGGHCGSSAYQRAFGGVMSCCVNVGFEGDQSLWLRVVILSGLSFGSHFGPNESLHLWFGSQWGCVEPLLAIVLSWLGPMSQK